MAAEVIIDTVSGAQLDSELFAKRKVRTGIVKNIELSTGAPDALVLEKAVDALIAAGYMLGSAISGSPDVSLTHYSMRSIDGFVNAVRFSLIYESPQFGGVQSAYIIRNSAIANTVETNRMPDGTPLTVQWAADSDTFGASAIQDFVPFRVFRPMRQVLVSALIYGRLDDPVPSFGLEPTAGGNDKADFTCYVNQDQWMGKAPGMWLLQKYETTTNRNANFFTIEAAAVSRVIESWAEYGTLYNSHIGKYVKIKDSNLTAANGRAYKPYTSGLIWPATGDDQFSGFLVWGPYPWTPFQAIFGF